MIETGKIFFTEEWEVLYTKETRKPGTYKKRLLPIHEKHKHDTSLWRSGDEVTFELITFHEKIIEAKILKIKHTL
jgi:hypothetical protein